LLTRKRTIYQQILLWAHYLQEVELQETCGIWQICSIIQKEYSQAFCQGHSLAITWEGQVPSEF
jgi:hypothetical protein